MSQNRYHFSVIVPVLNESGQINTLIENIHSCSQPYKCQIIIADGDSRGGTARAIRDNNIVAIISEPGRGRQMNAGAALATGDVLVFLHADTRLPRQAFARIDNLMRKDGFVAGAFTLAVDSKRFGLRYVELAAAFRSRLLRIPYGDQAIFMRKDYFEKIGRYKEIPLMEDVDLMRRIKKAGGKIAVLSERVSTSARKWEKDGILFGTLRNHVLVGLFYLGINPQTLARFYYGR
jgi:rSAM/selenodomain-associated transferase 2